VLESVVKTHTGFITCWNSGVDGLFIRGQRARYYIHGSPEAKPNEVRGRIPTTFGLPSAQFLSSFRSHRNQIATLSLRSRAIMKSSFKRADSERVFSPRSSGIVLVFLPMQTGVTAEVMTSSPTTITLKSQQGGRGMGPP